MSAETVALHGVRIRHEDRAHWTPDGVDLSLRAGEVTLLLGPSGSGKSTLTLALNGLIPQAIPADFEGEVHFAGRLAQEGTVAELSAQVAMVFQDPDAQLVTGTLLDEVCFGPENLGLPAAEVLTRGERALRQVGLWQRHAENPDRLSGGGKQRLAIACALALASPTIVLDEPTANLDPAGIEEVYRVLRELVASGEHAILLVEHNLDAAIELVDTVIVLNREGRIFRRGPARGILSQHAEELHREGVWLPVATLAALRLRAAGLPLDPLPLTPAELTEALDAEPRLPTLPSAAGGPGAASAASAGVDAVTEVTSATDASISAARPNANPDIGADAAIAASGIRDAADATNAAGDNHHENTTEATATIAAIASGPAITIAPTPPAEPLISVRDLRVHRKNVEILHGLSLDVGRGDFLAVVGVNGSGKTTLVQAIAGVVPPPRGRIRVADIDPGAADVRRIAARVGFVFQNPEHQFITGSVENELAHGLRMRGIPSDEIEHRVAAMLGRFGLTKLRQAHPFMLSGGQKRRLSVGTALIAGAPVLALDEPTFGQDRERATEILEILQELNAEGTTVIVVSHDMQLVAEYSSQLAIMHEGSLLACGPTGELLADAELIERAGLRPPPLAQAMSRLRHHPQWHGLARLRDLPGQVSQPLRPKLPSRHEDLS